MDIEIEIIATITKPTYLQQFFMGGISDDNFADKNCAEIYKFCVDYFRNYGGMEDAPSEDILKDNFDYYEELIDGAQKGASASYLIEQMQNKFIVNSLENSLRKFLPLLHENPRDVARLVLSSATSCLQRTVKKTQTVEYGVDLDYQEFIAKQSENVSAVPYPVDILTQKTGGMREGELTIFAAKASGGKTWFACDCALSAIKEGWNVYFATLEMTISDICQRIEFLDSGKISPLIYSQGIRQSKDYEEIKKVRERISGYEGRLVIDQPPAGERTVASLIARCRSHNCKFIIIDQLQFITKDARFEKSYQAIEQIMYEIKTAISAPNDGVKLSMLLMHQFNREGVKSQGKDVTIGTMSNLAGSSVIEQISDTVWGLGPSTDGTKNRRTLAVLKGRRFPEFGYQMLWETENRAKIDVDRNFEGEPVELEKW